MSETEQMIARSFLYAVAVVAVIVAAIWYGWELRTRLALKLEHFRIPQRAWIDYDEGERKKAAGELHDINAHRERQSEK